MRFSDGVELERQAKRNSCRIDRYQRVFASAEQQCVGSQIRSESFAEPAEIFQHPVERVIGRNASAPPETENLVGLNRREALKHFKGFLLYAQGISFRLRCAVCRLDLALRRAPRNSSRVGSHHPR